MTSLGSIPVLLREDGHVHTLTARRRVRRHIGRAHRRGLNVEVGHAHITADTIARTADGRHFTVRPTVTHITRADGTVAVDLRDAA